MIRFSICVHRPTVTVTGAGTLETGITCLTGPSGSGKSTLIKSIAGLVRPQAGEIWCDDVLWFSSESHQYMPPQARQVGYMPQGNMVFPHLSVRRNITFSQRGDEALFTRIVEELQLTRLLDKPAKQLSGGEQQRVALGRALYSKPRVLLLDEPLSALDWDLRHAVQQDLTRIMKEWHIPCLWVTHDQEEARQVGDVWWRCEAGQIKN